MSVNNNLQTGQGRIRVAKFTASGSWIAPAGVYAIQALAVGGGGGGGSARNNSANSAAIGGGGGGGGVVDETFSVVPGTTYTVTIGAGGAGANTSAAGSNGSDTTFGSLFTAPGGQGGVSMLLNNGYAPTTNPGGSMGGWAITLGQTVSTNGGSGCGAATPVLMAGKSDAGAVSDIMQPTQYTFFDGYALKSIPVLHYYENGSVSEAANIIYPALSATTVYRNVKRTNMGNQYVPSTTMYLPGYAWKGLGAGGQSLMTTTHGSDPAKAPWQLFSEPSAGKLDYISSPNNSGVTSGTNGAANTGAGGGGSRCGGTNNTIASGGNGGSGYVEIVWQE